MKRGRLKSMTLSIPVEEISSDVQRTLDGELEWGISVTDRGQTTSGHEFAKGRAALRKEIERDVGRVSSNDESVTIDATVRYTHITEFGEWLAVDDGWIVVSDEWVSGIVSTQIPGYPEDANLRLQELLDAVDPQDVWQMGFAGRGVVDGGSKGVLYGNNVDEDPDLGGELRHTPLNELGIEHIHESIPVKSYFAGGTGYVEVYDSEFTTRQFVDYCSRWVVDHIEGRDSTGSDKSQEGTEDDGEVQNCENCDRESESVQKTIVDIESGEVMELCVVCRDHVLETGEVPA